MSPISKVVTSIIRETITDCLSYNNRLRSFHNGFLKSVCVSLANINSSIWFSILKTNFIPIFFSILILLKLSIKSHINSFYQKCLLIVFMVTYYICLGSSWPVDRKVSAMIMPFLNQHPSLVDSSWKVHFVLFYSSFLSMIFKNTFHMVNLSCMMMNFTFSSTIKYSLCILLKIKWTLISIICSPVHSKLVI